MTINRRLIISVAAWLTLGAVGCSPLTSVNGQPSLKVSSGQLREALSKRFPRSYPAGNAFNLNLQAPQLRFMGEQNRLGVQIPLEASGPALQRSATGLFDVDFGLRYEPSDLSIRATQVKVNSLQIDGLPFAMKMVLTTYAGPLAEQALQDVVLHQFKPQDLTVPDGMGMQPGNISVTPDGLLIGFVPKT